MTIAESKALIPYSDWVLYADHAYLVAGHHPNGTHVLIHDEPPSMHTDAIHPEHLTKTASPKMQNEFGTPKWLLLERVTDDSGNIRETWAMQIDMVGCLVRVVTQTESSSLFGNKERIPLTEATTFVPSTAIGEQKNKAGDVVNRAITIMPELLRHPSNIVTPN